MGVVKVLVGAERDVKDKFDEIQEKMNEEAKEKGDGYVNQDTTFAVVVEAAYEKLIG